MSRTPLRYSPTRRRQNERKASEMQLLEISSDEERLIECFLRARSIRETSGDEDDEKRLPRKEQREHDEQKLIQNNIKQFSFMLEAVNLVVVEMHVKNNEILQLLTILP